jgi:hypothetical protein
MVTAVVPAYRWPVIVEAAASIGDGARVDVEARPAPRKAPQPVDVMAG